MSARRSRLRLALGVAIVCTLQVPGRCWAQQPDPNGLPYVTEQQTSGCPRLPGFQPLHASVVESCHRGDSVEVTLPLKPDADGRAQEKRVRGAYEFREYRIPQTEQDYAFDNLLNELPMAGFVVKYAVKPSTITARNGDLWILVNVSGDSYNVSLVREPPDTWASVKTAEEISREMQAHNRVEIYGIEFSPDDQSILEKQSQILFEILQCLKQSPELAVIIESHKVSKQAPPEKDGEITRERANAVMDWLVAHGIARSRVQPKPMGRNNPATENESPSQIQRNERIVLVKAPT